MIGLPAHDSTHTNTVKAMTTIAAMIVRRVSDEMLRVRVRWTAAVMSLPMVHAPMVRAARRHPPLEGAGRPHHAIRQISRRRA